MCGIVGYVGHDQSLLPGIETAVRSLGHRGPDAAAIKDWRVDGAACRIGHTRLRVLDLTPAADQPLSNEDGSVWVAFNGEIYNYPELRRELEASGHTFSTASDTEVLVHAYEQSEGDPQRMLNVLRGMFAFALWDHPRGRLLLARDRLGIKPLYWARLGSGVVFGSEVRAVQATGAVRADVDEAALGDYLILGHMRGTSTPIREIRGLPAGSFLSIDASAPTACHPVPWWHVARPGERPSGEVSLRATLADAVERHVRADRDVGVFLSGGVDSAVVASLAGRFGATRTLTVTWPDVGGDESVAARSVAADLGLQHQEIPFTGDELLSALPTAIETMDVPTADGINTWIVCAAARAAGHIVVVVRAWRGRAVRRLPLVLAGPFDRRADAATRRRTEGCSKSARQRRLGTKARRALESRSGRGSRLARCVRMHAGAVRSIRAQIKRGRSTPT